MGKDLPLPKELILNSTVETTTGSNLQDLMRINAKAIVGFVLPFILTYLANLGLDIDADALEVVLMSLIISLPTAFGVWKKRNLVRIVEVTQSVDVSPPPDA